MLPFFWDKKFCYEVVWHGRLEGKYPLYLQMPKFQSVLERFILPETIASYRGDMSQKKKNSPVLHRCGKLRTREALWTCSIKLVSLLNCRSGSAAPPFLISYFSLDKMRSDLQRTSERPIIVSKSLDDGWWHAARWQYVGCDGFWLIITFIRLPHLHHKCHFRLFCVVL